MECWDAAPQFAVHKAEQEIIYGFKAFSELDVVRRELLNYRGSIMFIHV